MKKYLISLILCFIWPLHALAIKQALIGTLNYNPPFETALSKQHYFFGFNIDIINSVCKTIDYHCQLVPMRFDKLIKALDQKKLDAIIVGISLYPLKQEHYISSYPYFIGNARLLGLSSNRLNTLNDKKVGMVRQTLLPAAKKYDLIDNKDSFLKHNDLLNIVYYLDLPQLLMGLNRRQVDVIMLDAGTAWYWQQQSNNRYLIIGPSISLPKGMRIIARRDKKNLITRINKALKAMEDDGRLLAIYKKYWNSIHPSSRYQGALIPIGKPKRKFYIRPLLDSHTFKPVR